MTTETHDAPPETQRPVDLDALDALQAEIRDWRKQAAQYAATHHANTDAVVLLQDAALLLDAFADLTGERPASNDTARVRELEAANARLTADAARLDAAQRYEWAMIPQVGGGWVFEGSYPMSESGDCDTYTAVRTRADLRAAIDAALATEAPPAADRDATRPPSGTTREGR